MLLTLLLSAVIAGETSVGRTIDPFELRDFRGKVHKLADHADHKALVVVFLGNECPLANQYIPRLTSIAKDYADRGVSLLAINANIQDSLTEMTGYALRHELTFPLLKDPDAGVADRFGATRTPEVFLLDADRVVRYHGRIDDQLGVGYQKPKADSNDLVRALDELLAGKSVSQPHVAATGCIIGRPPRPELSASDVTYTRQISRLFNDRCVSCHRAGEIAPFPMTSYDDVVGWAPTIREAIDAGRMPPWFASPEHGKFKNDCRLSEEEKNLVRRWVDAGSPLGDEKDLPEPPQFVDGWQIGTPDQIINIAQEPIPVAAEGTIEYQYYTADPGWTEDKWIQASECRPGNRAVVHHIIAFIQEPNSGPGESRSGIGGYAPGMPPDIHEPGTAKFVKAGSKIVFQMHYTPNGREETDLSCIGVKFVDDPSSITHLAHGGLAANFMFRIPPGADNHEVKSSYTFKRDLTLRSLTPHMHLRGKSFTFEAKYPDGKMEILLDVPRYDFNWQLRYELAEPKLMPKGTQIRCTAHFDNSEGNLNNPDPKAAVRWGDQTWEEMMIGWFSTTRPVEKDSDSSDEETGG
jgi:peroxiredoxin